MLEVVTKHILKNHPIEIKWDYLPLPFLWLPPKISFKPFYFGQTLL
jgi:hypothetical protein